eukprot:gnl/TRDRNA2_/TRDRNA2_192293_c0_seq1.p1 gnl/TRDRNA2_/TRDRNA2_192293_c0~~gnl/TRDRNA2_/TRDRNA2_192293_c0_seq1.p1  ORF type:complete len:332 (+),score=77.04 gnl/TRDRNA2_/TRDRNA2_192293_c0_seq1:88-996(+)
MAIVGAGMLASVDGECNQICKNFMNAKKEQAGKDKTMHVLPSGMVYKVLKSGEDLYHPGPGETVLVEYEGKILDGRVFASSEMDGKPYKTTPFQSTKGWEEALQLMVPGDRWELYLPSELHYGDKGHGHVTPGMAVIYWLELVKIEGPGVRSKKCDRITYQMCTDDEKEMLKKHKESTIEQLEEAIKGQDKVVNGPAGRVRAKDRERAKVKMATLENMIRDLQAADIPCDIETREHCRKAELELLDRVEGKTAEDLKSELKSVEKKLKESLKKPERIEKENAKKMLKALIKKAKAKAKGEDL